MKFTLQITIDNPTKGIKDCIMEEVASYLGRHGYSYDVGYDPNEIDITTLYKA